MAEIFKAKKANVVLQIKEEAVDRYLSKGFSIYTVDGDLVTKSAPQTLAEFQEENKILKEKIAKLEAQLEKKNDKPKKEKIVKDKKEEETE